MISIDAATAPPRWSSPATYLPPNGRSSRRTSEFQRDLAGLPSGKLRLRVLYPTSDQRRSPRMRLGRIALAAAALIAASASAAPIKLGVVNSMTGPEAPIGEDLSNGI